MKAKEIYMYVLGALVVCCAVGTIGMLVFNPLPEANHDVMMLAIGQMLGWAGSVVAYFYGSSKGSSDKTELLNKEKVQ